MLILFHKQLLKKTVRTIAISNENFSFLTENIKEVSSLGWPTKSIKIYSDNTNSSELFEFKNKKQNNFYLLKYIELYNLLKKK